ncbi:MAG TPA: SH3 domain-containing protein, partial [Anaerolineae bacterium]|nr:SH3 domain-containing protein [Anaerolineae bacterium]
MTIRSALPCSLRRPLLAALSLLLAAGVALPIQPTAISAAGQPQITPGSTLRVNVAALNVRSGPGLSFPTIGQVGAGTQLDVVATDDGSQWLQVCCVNGQQGWLRGAAEFVSTAGAAAEQPAAPSGQPLVSSSGTVNLRSGPGTAFSRVGTLRAGQTLPILGKNENASWWQVETAGAKAWVANSVVRTAGPVNEVAVAQDIPQPPAQAAAASGPAPAPGAPGFFGYGIQIDPYADRGSAIGLIKNMSFNWVKFQLAWKDFEGQPGQRNWPDDVVGELNGNGLSILASIVKAPAWARGANPDLSVEGPPADPATYASFVGEFASRYCGRVQAIEVWNEQNLHYEWGNEALDAGRYVRLLAAAYRAIKAACPTMIVVSGAPTPTGAQPPAAVPDFAYLERMYQAGLKSYADAIGVHPSGYGNPPDARVQDAQAGTYSRPSHFDHASFYFRNVMEQYRNIMVKYGDGNKRLWPTEFGWASSNSP